MRNHTSYRSPLRQCTITDNFRLLAVVWFRILAKVVQGMTDNYYWQEMTILIHQPINGSVTVICFDMPHESMSSFISTKKPPSNFIVELRDELNSLHNDYIPDWRFMQAAILRRAVAILDRAVWTNSDAVRMLEKVPTPSPTADVSSSNIRFSSLQTCVIHIRR